MIPSAVSFGAWCPGQWYRCLTVILFFFQRLRPSLSAGGSLLLLPLSLWMERCMKGPCVFIPPSVIFSPLSFLVLRFFGQAGSELTNRDSPVVSLPRRDGNITPQRERLSQQSILLKARPASHWNVMQMHWEHIEVSDGVSHLWHLQNKTPPNPNRTDSDDLSFVTALNVFFVSRHYRTLLWLNAAMQMSIDRSPDTTHLVIIRVMFYPDGQLSREINTWFFFHLPH